MTPDGHIRLFIENVKPSDSGAYKVMISNPSGDCAMVCAVAVKPEPRAPTFLKPITDKAVAVGEALNLEGQILAFPAPEIQWFKDGIQLRPSETVNFVLQPDGVIGIKYGLKKLSVSFIYCF